tara:strand:- start:348 stop:707 length:360 start_codon:yes stop_codon:yes gene_type:complete
MMERPERPLIDRQRYVSKPPTLKNTNTKIVNKPKFKTQKKKQMQPPVSGSMKRVSEVTELKPPAKPQVKSRITEKKKTKKSPRRPLPPHRIEKPKKDESGIFKQMKDKFVGKPKDEGGN